MKTGHFNILIADRNPHVRELLKREIALEGYNVFLAKSGTEVIDKLRPSNRLDLIIIDPDIVDLRESDLLEILGGSHFSLPVVIHTFSKDDLNKNVIEKAASVVEKGGGSIELLKQAVFEILCK
jgi:DNA-binding NtrC family response regulator